MDGSDVLGVIVSALKVGAEACRAYLWKQALTDLQAATEQLNRRK